MSIERYRAEVGGDKTVWPIVVLDANGPLVYHTDHKRELAAKQTEIERLTAQNLNLRGADQTVYFHGTQPENVEAIKQDGFKEGTYFARHMEDAVAFGGPCVFSVNVHFETPPLDGWQVICANAIPPAAIRDYTEVANDKVRSVVERLTAQVARLSAPVSDEELAPYVLLIEDGDGHKGWFIDPEQVEVMFAARAAGSKEAENGLPSAGKETGK
jgi:hypothetical protein